MSDKSKICAIGEKKLIGGKWYEKAELEGGSYACTGCAFVYMRIDCDVRQNTAVEDGGYECVDSIWIACAQPQPETPAVEECAGCRYWHKEAPEPMISPETSNTRLPYHRPCRRMPDPINKHESDWCGEWKA